jgi:EF hand
MKPRVDMAMAGLRRMSRNVPTTCLSPGLPAFALLIWPAALCLAQVTATDEYLARMDVDQDGRIALTEYQAWMGYAFERMDANHDGMLTPDELPGGRGKPVSLVEHRETLAAMFRHQDVDQDGFLSTTELAAPPR